VLPMPAVHSALNLPTLTITLDEIRSKVNQKFQLEGRRYQLEEMLAILNGRDVLVIAGTGSGKSLVFQGLCAVNEDGIVLVISPLKALMHNHVYDTLV
jgi:superfamily II DNA helicase RecQ